MAGAQGLACRHRRSAQQDVGNLRAFEPFLGRCAACHGQELHKAALARDCGVSQPTIGAWVGVLEASVVVALLPPYFRNYGNSRRPRTRAMWTP